MKTRTINVLIVGIFLLFTICSAAGHPIDPHSQIVQHNENPKTIRNDIIVDILKQVQGAQYLIYEENLLTNGPRPTGSANCIAAAEYIYEQFQTMGLTVRYHRWNNGGYSSENIEATINGTDSASDAIYIVCAHYDTVTVSPGADDDTSGTAAVLLTALLLSQHPFNDTIKFVCFSGEEQGLLGSEIYAQEAAAQGWNISGVLNCDMISYANSSENGSNLNVCQNIPSAWLYEYAINISLAYADVIGPLTLHNDGFSYGSDQYYFWVNGYDAIFYHEYGPTPYYHSAQDTLDHINLTYAVKNTKLVIATLAELAGILSHPPTTPLLTGPNTGSLNETYMFNAISTDPDDDTISYFFDWGDGTNTGWLGPYQSGQQITAQKSWNAPGTYPIYVQAKDINERTSEWSIPLMMTILPNLPPTPPTITGPTEGNPGISYLYTFTTTDPEADILFYEIDWGDGHISEWIGPYNSGATASAAHQWANEGTYLIQARAKDIHNAMSTWGSLSIVMPKDVKTQQMLQNTMIRSINNKTSV
jgi:hypothetical protein